MKVALRRWHIDFFFNFFGTTAIRAVKSTLVTSSDISNRFHYQLFKFKKLQLRNGPTSIANDKKISMLFWGFVKLHF
jgi:hypothetical protein